MPSSNGGIGVTTISSFISISEFQSNLAVLFFPGMSGIEWPHKTNLAGFINQQLCGHSFPWRLT
jgi:hypothetical protein